MSRVLPLRGIQIIVPNRFNANQYLFFFNILHSNDDRKLRMFSCCMQLRYVRFLREETVERARGEQSSLSGGTRSMKRSTHDAGRKKRGKAVKQLKPSVRLKLELYPTTSCSISHTIIYNLVRHTSWGRTDRSGIPLSCTRIVLTHHPHREMDPFRMISQSSLNADMFLTVFHPLQQGYFRRLHWLPSPQVHR